MITGRDPLAAVWSRCSRRKATSELVLGFQPEGQARPDEEDEAGSCKASQTSLRGIELYISSVVNDLTMFIGRISVNVVVMQCFLSKRRKTQQKYPITWQAQTRLGRVRIEIH